MFFTSLQKHVFQQKVTHLDRDPHNIVSDTFNITKTPALTMKKNNNNETVQYDSGLYCKH